MIQEYVFTFLERIFASLGVLSSGRGEPFLGRRTTCIQHKWFRLVHITLYTSSDGLAVQIFRSFNRVLSKELSRPCGTLLSVVDDRPLPHCFFSFVLQKQPSTMTGRLRRTKHIPWSRAFQVPAHFSCQMQSVDKHIVVISCWPSTINLSPLSRRGSSPGIGSSVGNEILVKDVTIK